MASTAKHFLQLGGGGYRPCVFCLKELSFPHVVPLIEDLLRDMHGVLTCTDVA
jgi:hypothetical protein